MFSISHVGTCLSCYVQDHHNRDGEWLIGVTVDNTTTYAQMRDDLDMELSTGGMVDTPDWTAEEIKAALDDLFANANPEAFFDDSLEAATDDMIEPCQAWFLVTWDSDDEE